MRNALFFYVIIAFWIEFGLFPSMFPLITGKPILSMKSVWGRGRDPSNIHMVIPFKNYLSLVYKQQNTSEILSER